MRAQDSFRLSFLFGGGADTLHFFNKGHGVGSWISRSSVDVLVHFWTLGTLKFLYALVTFQSNFSRLLLLIVYIGNSRAVYLVLEGHTSGYNWWISIRSVNNIWHWRKLWKRFHWSFDFQSRVSTKMVVNSSQCLPPEMFYGHGMFIDEARDVFLLRFIAVASIGEKLSKFKIAAQTSMTFAAKFFSKEITPNKFQ